MSETDCGSQCEHVDKVLHDMSAAEQVLVWRAASLASDSKVRQTPRDDVVALVDFGASSQRLRMVERCKAATIFADSQKRPRTIHRRGISAWPIVGDDRAQAIDRSAQRTALSGTG